MTPNASVPRLLIVAPSAYVLSGLASWLDDVEPQLSDAGWDVTVGLVAGPRYHRPDVYLREHSHRRCVAIPCANGTPEGRRRAIERAVDSLQPDVVASVNIADVYPAVHAMRVAGRSRAKVVMALHGIQPDLFDDLRRYALAIDGVISTNQVGCRLATRLGGIDETRVHYAPCGVVVPPLAAAAGRGGALRVAYVGRLDEPQKRVGDLPPIVAELRARNIPVEFSIVGDGPEGPALRTAFAGAGASSGSARVSLVGRLGRSRVRDDVYPRMDALLVTSNWETGPIVAWEAMASGVPVVSARYVGSCAEGALIERDTALLFDVGDVAGAAAALDELRTNATLRDRLRTNAHAMVGARYRDDVAGAAWDSAFRDILAAPPLANSAIPSIAVPAGRLDRWVGARRAEDVRHWFRRQGPDAGPGGEWPHSHSDASADDAAFWRTARDEDRRNGDVRHTNAPRAAECRT